MENSNDTGKVIGALLVGALVGAALGILFAPDKGSITRSKLVGGAQGLADDIKEKIKDEVSAMREKIEELESLADDKISDLTKNATQKADAFKDQS